MKRIAYLSIVLTALAVGCNMPADQVAAAPVPGSTPSADASMSPPGRSIDSLMPDATKRPGDTVASSPEAPPVRPRPLVARTAAAAGPNAWGERDPAPPRPPVASGIPDEPAPAPAVRTHVVAPKDTFWSLAARYLGDGRRWPEIARSNPAIKPGALPVGGAVVIPIK